MAGGVKKLHEARPKLRGELEAPPALRRFGRGWISGDLPKEKWPEGYGIGGHPVPLGYLKQFKYPFQRKKAAE